MSPLLRFILIVLAGIGLGALLGWTNSCSSGACPLTSTWWRGALYGGVLGVLLAASFRS
ncbi:hypothetical protein K0B96_13545 [Horticoccus luteus]|uniref:Uncharacterized protein n=1 Tax=Horticoccus luteus TaxID=2862869 RepID=A0A8F9TSM9_9BACT|nr:DUF6132 family protein [Horticoccus luteus]QYM78316.1 hypothetical protein K0B96_13545 [Horticoccus luteus]